jgi:hypothetical protein
MMKKLVAMSLALGVTVSAPVALAHPTDVPYASRGACERAAADSAKNDRERLVAVGIFPTIGAAQSTFHDDWQCEYDEEARAWFIVDHRND